MRKICITVMLLLAAGCVYAAKDQAYLGMFAETTSMKMAGMPGLPPGVDPSMLGGGGGMFGGDAQRSLTIRLWSPGLAPKDAFASIIPPEKLKQGKKMDLEIDRPKPEKITKGNDGDSEDTPSKPEEFTIKYYWGSSEKVRPGQPKIVKFGSLTPEQQKVMEKEMKKAERGGSSYFYKPDWTTAYWPTQKQPGKIAKDSALPGHYDITTNYTGNAAIDVPGNVDFLNPIEMSSPNLKKPVKLEPAINFEWAPIPNLLGSHAMMMGMEGNNTMVIWDSSEISADMGIDYSYLQMSEVKDYVKQTIMMKGDRTKVSVPAGIFKKCEGVFFNMVGYGPGAALAEGQPLPRVQTKTNLSIMMGGKDMEGMEESSDEGDENEFDSDEAPRSGVKSPAEAQQKPTVSKSGSKSGKKISDEAEETVDDAVDETKNEKKDELKDKAKEKIKGVLKGLF